MKGFSLGELLVSLAVLALMLAAAFGILRAGLGAYAWGAARVDAQQSARIALDRMARELRGAGFDPTGSGLAPIAAAGPALVTFERDAGGAPSRVTFLLRAGETVLRRDAGAGAQPIIDNVRRLRFAYFDRAGLATGDPARVASVRIELEVGAAGPTAVMQTEVAIRNRGGR
jgi:prepilin-type N-terminal cleavage/methylation domain-containing protein